MTGQMTPIPFDLDQALLGLLRHIQELMPCDTSGLHLHDPESRMLIPHAYLGGGGHVVSSMPLGRGAIGEVGETQQPVVIGDMTADPRCVFTDPDSRSELAVPVLYDNTLLGVFNVESHQRDAYTDHHLAILRAMADQAALLLHTAQQYEKLGGRGSRHP